MLGTSDAWLMRRLPHWPSKPGIILKIVGFLESYAYFLPPHISPRFSNLATTLDYLLSKLWRWVGERKQIPLPFFVVCFLPLLRRAFLCIFAWNHIISYIQAYMSAFKKLKNCPIESFLFLQSLLSFFTWFHLPNSTFCIETFWNINSHFLGDFCRNLAGIILNIYIRASQVFIELQLLRSLFFCGFSATFQLQ